jgi:hypothetical protein
VLCILKTAISIVPEYLYSYFTNNSFVGEYYHCYVWRKSLGYSNLALDSYSSSIEHDNFWYNVYRFSLQIF